MSQICNISGPEEVDIGISAKMWYRPIPSADSSFHMTMKKSFTYHIPLAMHFFIKHRIAVIYQYRQC